MLVSATILNRVALAALLLGLSLVACACEKNVSEPTGGQAGAVEAGTAGAEGTETSTERSPNTLIVAGGAFPDSNQVQMEQDAALAIRVLRKPQRVLFGGGAESRSVQVRDGAASSAPPTLERRLAAILAPRPGRDAEYRVTELPVDAPARRADVVRELERALEGRDDVPLDVFVATHGLPGPTPVEGALDLWAATPLRVNELARILDEGDHTEPARFVITACYSGSFAEIVFQGADPYSGPAQTPRCGLFATTWDLEASGCDPDPTRRRQEGYALHMLHALEGRDRDGDPLPSAALDIDGDGEVSLLEAHTRARIAGRGIDVPTTTSERWLREVAPSHGDVRAVELPAERAVIDALGEATGLEDARAASHALVDVETRSSAALAREESAAAEEQRAYYDLLAELLSRWPELDDPWHPDFRSTLETNRDAIRSFLDTHETSLAWHEARSELDAHVDARNDLALERALVERLWRAYETIELARRLRAVGGAEWAVFEELRACERSVP